jgi:hypothetical protein
MPRSTLRHGGVPRSREEAEGQGAILLGQTLGHAFGDGPAFWYPYLWSWGGKEVEADGKTVVLTAREPSSPVKFAVGWWKDACDEGAFAGMPSGNNRAFLAGAISATNNSASIYLEAKKKPDSYDRNRQAAQGRLLPLTAPQGSRRPVQLARAAGEYGHGVFQEPESGERFPAVVSFRKNL